MHFFISACSVLLLVVKTNAAHIPITSLKSPNLHRDSINHTSHNHSSHAAIHNQPCPDCVNLEDQKVKSKEIEPSIRAVDDYILEHERESRGALPTTTFEDLIEEEPKTVIELELVEPKHKRTNNKETAPCLAAAAFIESLLNSREPKESSKEAVLEELYDLYDQLKKNTPPSDEEDEVEEINLPIHSSRKEKDKRPKKKQPKKSSRTEYYSVAGESLKVNTPEDIEMWLSNHDEENGSPSEDRSRFSTEFESGDDVLPVLHTSTIAQRKSPRSRAHKIKLIHYTSPSSEEDESTFIEDIHSTKVKNNKVNRIKVTTHRKTPTTVTLPVVTTESLIDKDVYTTESPVGVSDTTFITHYTDVPTETPLTHVNAHVSVVLKEKEHQKPENITHTLRKAKIVENYHVENDNPTSANKNVTEIASVTEVEQFTEPKQNKTDREKNIAMVDIELTLSEKHLPSANGNHNNVSLELDESMRYTDTTEEETVSTKDITVSTKQITETTKETTETTKETTETTKEITESTRETTESTKETTEVTDATTEGSKVVTLKITVPNRKKHNRLNRPKLESNDEEESRCINLLSTKYPLLKFILQKNNSQILNPVPIFVPVPVEYFMEVFGSASLLRPKSNVPRSCYYETRQKSCKRLRILTSKVLDALEKMEISKTSHSTSSDTDLIEKLKSRLPRNIKSDLFSGIADASYEDVKD